MATSKSKTSDDDTTADAATPEPDAKTSAYRGGSTFAERAQLRRESEKRIRESSNKAVKQAEDK